MPTLNDQLIEAAENGHTDTVALLLDRGADVHADDDYALHWAALKGRTETVALLLDRGANVHAYDDSALRWAVLNGHTDTVALLLDRGADVRADDDCALHWAAKYGHTDIVALLKSHQSPPIAEKTATVSDLLKAAEPLIKHSFWDDGTPFTQGEAARMSNMLGKIHEITNGTECL